MALKINGSLGDIFVDSNVIARIAGAVANQCYGVVGMASRNKKDGFVNLLKPDAMTKGIKVDAADGGIVVELHIIVEYGVTINVICQSIVNNVKYKLEHVTGLQVNKVVVNVEGVRVDE
ncbi:MAG: Asp23/Gls24 family envelope stress response protein [Clostridia bacterium]|nr:Asp23/Gls24 family envelope stress response protein [Clostridia bacterium]